MLTLSVHVHVDKSQRTGKNEKCTCRYLRLDLLYIRRSVFSRAGSMHIHSMCPVLIRTAWSHDITDGVYAHAHYYICMQHSEQVNTCPVHARSTRDRRCENNLKARPVVREHCRATPLLQSPRQRLGLGHAQERSDAVGGESSVSDAVGGVVHIIMM